jgi:fatty acid desaturase
MTVDGVTYDITDFKHPGGNIINYAKNTPDSTDTFNEFHYRSPLAKKLLRSLPVYRGDDADTDADLTQEQREMTADYREMRATLIEKGLFEPDYIHVYFRMMELLFYFALGTGLAAYNIYASMISFIVFKTRCGWVQHECGHLSFTGNRHIDRAIQTFTMGFGGGTSSSVWNSMHQKHHATPQKVKYDIDLDTTPFVAFFNRAFEDNLNGKASARFMNRWWMRFQAWTFLPVVNGILVHLFWIYYLHPRKVLMRLNTARTIETKLDSGFELVCMATLHLVYPYIFSTYAQYGLVYSYFLGMVLNFWNFIYLFGHFSLSHSFTRVVPEDKHLLWFEYAIQHTVNISTNSALVTWIMGYLNFQIEHHLFPSMPQYKNALAAPYVREFCKKWAKHLTYTEHSYFTAWRLMLSNLNQVGKHYYANGIDNRDGGDHGDDHGDHGDDHGDHGDHSDATTEEHLHID